MQLSLFTALALLVLTAIGFLAGRSRALALAARDGSRTHSLPNYHGYYVALWAAIPGFGLLAAYAVAGTMLANSLALGEMERAAEPLQARFEAVLAGDEEYTQAQTRFEALANELDALRAEAEGVIEAEGLQSERIAALREQQDALQFDQDDARFARDTRADTLLAQMLETVPETGEQALARAGMEYARLPVEQREVFLADARALASGDGLASRDTASLRALADTLAPIQTAISWGAGLGALALALGGLLVARTHVSARFRARNRVEWVISAALALASLIAILTTLGIVFSLLFESLRFFASIDWRVADFLFGTQWSPQTAIRAGQIGQSGSFGAVPLFAGTALITLIAMLVAAPVGLFAAVYLSEYADSGTRAWAKPLLEILAGVPTVVYGFFALLTVGPLLRDFALFLGYEDAVTQSALSAGLVMGVMIIPFVSSLSDDVINAVPQSLRDGAYAMGATKSETIRHVVFPAALPGIVGALLLAVSRAVGETMIVVMAAGQAANLTANPLESVTTITVQIVTLLTGDQEFNSPKTLSAFALGLVLFVLTLILNVIALRVVQSYREKYD
ncbi:MAG: phosphate ABC transporter permease subunit PstC [Caulobacterales bacterium]|uniref:phosphate ABC transporter permease subunit PstC n=1 Tax=Glycocaulis sp. TaxID=1969725 RepID=UPI003FA0253F